VASAIQPLEVLKEEEFTSDGEPTLDFQLEGTNAKRMRGRLILAASLAIQPLKVLMEEKFTLKRELAFRMLAW